MKQCSRPLLLAGLCGLFLWLLADAGTVRADASEALALCAGNVIPALLPFLVLSDLLASLGVDRWLAPLFSGLMGPLFRLPGCAASAWLLGLAGGYPVGPRAAAELYRRGRLTLPEACRLLAFCSNASPAFLISVLGAGVFGSTGTGVCLWLIHLTASLLTGLLFRGGRREPRRAVPSVPEADVSFPGALSGAILRSGQAMTAICTCVVFFYVLAAPLRRIGGPAAPLLAGLTELFTLTPLLTADRGGLVLASACTGWGGLSVLCQNASVLEGSGLPIRACLRGKLMQGLLAGVLTALLAPVLLP